jgi:DNA-binding phage protein
MAKIKISPERAGSWDGRLLKRKPGSLSRPYDPTITLRDPKFIQKAMFQALAEGDFQGVVDIYRAHLRVLNRTRSAKALHISRQSIHKMLKPSGNPSLRTFTAFMKYLNKSAAAV